MYIRQCTYGNVHTTMYIQRCTYDVHTTMYIRCTYDDVHTMHIRRCTYDNVHTTMYIRCIYDVHTTMYIRRCTYDVHTTMCAHLFIYFLQPKVKTRKHIFTFFLEILKKCFLSTTCIVISVACSNVIKHNSVLPVTKLEPKHLLILLVGSLECFFPYEVPGFLCRKTQFEHDKLINLIKIYKYSNGKRSNYDYILICQHVYSSHNRSCSIVYNHNYI